MPLVRDIQLEAVKNSVIGNTQKSGNLGLMLPQWLKIQLKMSQTKTAQIPDQQPANNDAESSQLLPMSDSVAAPLENTADRNSQEPKNTEISNGTSTEKEAVSNSTKENAVATVENNSAVTENAERRCAVNIQETAPKQSLFGAVKARFSTKRVKEPEVELAEQQVSVVSDVLKSSESITKDKVLGKSNTQEQITTSQEQLYNAEREKSKAECVSKAEKKPSFFSALSRKPRNSPEKLVPIVSETPTLPEITFSTESPDIQSAVQAVAVHSKEKGGMFVTIANKFKNIGSSPQSATSTLSVLVLPSAEESGSSGLSLQSPEKVRDIVIESSSFLEVNELASAALVIQSVIAPHCEGMESELIPCAIVINSNDVAIVKDELEEEKKPRSSFFATLTRPFKKSAAKSDVEDDITLCVSQPVVSLPKEDPVVLIMEAPETCIDDSIEKIPGKVVIPNDMDATAESLLASSSPVSMKSSLFSTIARKFKSTIASSGSEREVSIVLPVEVNDIDGAIVETPESVILAEVVEIISPQPVKSSLFSAIAKQFRSTTAPTASEVEVTIISAGEIENAILDEANPAILEIVVEDEGVFTGTIVAPVVISSLLEDTSIDNLVELAALAESSRILVADSVSPKRKSFFGTWKRKPEVIHDIISITEPVVVDIGLIVLEKASVVEEIVTEPAAHDMVVITPVTLAEINVKAPEIHVSIADDSDYQPETPVVTSEVTKGGEKGMMSLFRKITSKMRQTAVPHAVFVDIEKKTCECSTITTEISTNDTEMQTDANTASVETLTEPEIKKGTIEMGIATEVQVDAMIEKADAETSTEAQPIKLYSTFNWFGSKIQAQKHQMMLETSCLATTKDMKTLDRMSQRLSIDGPISSEIQNGLVHSGLSVPKTTDVSVKESVPVALVDKR